MNIFPWKRAQKSTVERTSSQPKGGLGFYSTAALERGLDGGDDRYAEYIFAIYHCLPDEHTGVNVRREQLRGTFPEKVVQIGQHFVLVGEPAYLVLSEYYRALAVCETLSEEFRAYANERLDQIGTMHRNSQSLPVPIDLTEGQLSQDRRLEFLTCIALSNGQVRQSEA